MNKVSFIQLSDIHLVKSSGNSSDIDKDLRDAIITDLKVNGKTALDNLKGVLVCGDIAFSGNETEYEKATDFLNEVTKTLDLKNSDVFCVPGNHDVNQASIQRGGIIYGTQSEIEQAKSLDEADKIFDQKLKDTSFNNVLFKSTDEYNNFASKFECRTDVNEITWKYNYQLDYDLNLCLFGMNSCFLSNENDHRYGGKDKDMYIGQVQIPPRIENTVFLTLCHHPKEQWIFNNDLKNKFNKRADIQLFGHMHTQKFDNNDDNIIIYSGATQPTRGKEWYPTYNWISIEVMSEKEERSVKVSIYPRILSNDRDRFITDDKICKGAQHISHTLNIDKKRKKDLIDKYTTDSSVATNFKIICDEETPTTCVNLRELVYTFMNLSYIRQTQILVKLNLLNEDDNGKRYSTIINKIVEDALIKNLIDEMWKLTKENGGN